MRHVRRDLVDLSGGALLSGWRRLARWKVEALQALVDLGRPLSQVGDLAMTAPVPVGPAFDNLFQHGHHSGRIEQAIFHVVDDRGGEQVHAHAHAAATASALPGLGAAGVVAIGAALSRHCAIL